MKVLIVHGCPDNNKDSTYDKHWLPWIKEKLKEKGIEVITPLMPTPWKAIYEEWKKKFDEMNIDKEDIFIGHSCGCAFLVRWLGETKKKVRKLILVAPWKILYGDYLRRQDKLDFYEFDINHTIKDRIGDVIIFTSEDEEEVGRKSARIFQDAFDGKLIELRSHGHFTEEDMGTNEFPELLEEVLKTK